MCIARRQGCGLCRSHDDSGGVSPGGFTWGCHLAHSPEGRCASEAAGWFQRQLGCARFGRGTVRVECLARCQFRSAGAVVGDSSRWSSLTPPSRVAAGKAEGSDHSSKRAGDVAASMEVWVRGPVGPWFIRRGRDRRGRVLPHTHYRGIGICHFI